MNLDIGFKPTVAEMGIGSRSVFDFALNPVEGKDTLAGGGKMPQWGRAMGLAATGLQMYAQTTAGLTQIDNIMANIGRTERNIEQLELELMDTLDVQVRKVSKRHGAQMAQIGASGVAFSGSPLMVMAETHARGMQDYDAIEQKGRFAIDDAYRSIYDSLDQAKDIGKGMMIGAVTTLAGGMYGYAKTGS